MFQKILVFTAPFVVAVAATLVMPAFSRAQHGGGSHGGTGGAHFGGAHLGGSHSGGFSHGDFHSGVHEGMHHDPVHGGLRYYGYYRPYYGRYRYSPYYYGSYYPDNYYDAYPPFLSLSELYESGYADPDYPDHADIRARITVRAPADAKVWFNNTPTTTTGDVRRFESPPLAAGNYTYDVEARWNQNGHPVSEVRHVQVTPGSHVEIDFPVEQAAQAGKK